MTVDTSLKPRYPGIWTLKSRPFAFRSLPKCACSTIGQVMHYVEAGKFFKGDIHDDRVTLMKWGHTENDWAVIEALNKPDLFSFIFVRNPYRRLLSAFSDKMFGYQSYGTRYGGGTLHSAAEPFGMRFDATSNIFDSFVGFLRYVEAAVKGQAPSDIHWSPMSQQLRFNIARFPPWPLHFVGYVEHLSEDLDTALARGGIDKSGLPQKLPRENATSIGFTCERMFSTEAIEIVRRVYAEDFETFGYETDIAVGAPSIKRESGEVYDRLRHIYQRRGTKA